MNRRLKVLWLTFYGSWTLPLIYQLKKEVELCVVIPSSQSNKKIVEDGVIFYHINMPIKFCLTEMTSTIAQKYIDVINEFDPDLIHVHGTEKNLAQLHNYCPNIPMVVSIQGILTGYIPYATNSLSKKDVLPYKSIKNIFGYGGLFAMQKLFVSGSEKYEIKILNNIDYFFCRTSWDKKWVTKMNSKALIFQGEELLRQPFYSNANKWDISKCTRHQIFMPAGFNPIKGLHYAVRTVAKLKEKWPDVQLHVPGIEKRMLTRNWLWQFVMGEEYIKYILQLIRKLDIENNVTFYDRLDADQMMKEMLQANVFLSPSSIDNSPNAIGEAMMLGLPIVSTPVGGVPSIIQHQKNGLLSSPEYLADNISLVFQSDELARKLGREAFLTALKRHDKEKTKQQYLEAYYKIVSNKNNQL